MDTDSHGSDGELGNSPKASRLGDRIWGNPIRREGSDRHRPPIPLPFGCPQFGCQSSRSPLIRAHPCPSVVKIPPPHAVLIRAPGSGSRSRAPGALCKEFFVYEVVLPNVTQDLTTDGHGFTRIGWGIGQLSEGESPGRPHLGQPNPKGGIRPSPPSDCPPIRSPPIRLGVTGAPKAPSE